MNVPPPRKTKKRKKAARRTTPSDYLAYCFCALLMLGIILLTWRDYVHREARAAYWETMPREVRPPKDMYMNDGSIGGIQVRDPVNAVWSSIPLDVRIVGGVALLLAACAAIATHLDPGTRAGEEGHPSPGPTYQDNGRFEVPTLPNPPPPRYDKGEAYAAWGPGP